MPSAGRIGSLARIVGSGEGCGHGRGNGQKTLFRRLLAKTIGMAVIVPEGILTISELWGAAEAALTGVMTEEAKGKAP